MTPIERDSIDDKDLQRSTNKRINRVGIIRRPTLRGRSLATDRMAFRTLHRATRLLTTKLLPFVSNTNMTRSAKFGSEMNSCKRLAAERFAFAIAFCAATCALFGDPCRAVGPGAMLPAGNGHPLVNGHLPPGAVGQTRLHSQHPVAGYFQPVKFSGPSGTQFALPQGGATSPAEPNLMAGLLIGNVYRFKITGIPNAPGAELFPTLEVIDRTYPPPGLATSFPIPINLDQIDLEEALNGQMVTRVIYLEDQQSAAPLPRKPDDASALDVAHYQDPLEVADRMGRPVAIVRIGSLAPPTSPQLIPEFYFGFPTWAPIFQPAASVQPIPALQSNSADATATNQNERTMASNVSSSAAFVASHSADAQATEPQ